MAVGTGTARAFAATTITNRYAQLVTRLVLGGSERKEKTRGSHGYESVGHICTVRYIPEQLKKVVSSTCVQYSTFPNS